MTEQLFKALTKKHGLQLSDDHLAQHKFTFFFNDGLAYVEKRGAPV